MEQSDKDLVVAAVASALSIDPSMVAPLVVRPKSLALGDWALPCFSFAKEMKVSPPDCAKVIKEKIPTGGLIEKIEAAGPYLNFFISRAQWNEKIIAHAHTSGKEIGKRPANNKSVVLEYSSPNIAKTIHVGHLRTTLIGLCLDRVYRHLGYDVVSVNHLGDWGTQFGFVYAGCLLWGRPENPTVDELVELYVKASNLRKLQDQGKAPEEDSDKPVVNDIAREYFIRLENGDAEATEFWKWCLDISLKYLIANYDRLGIKFDHYTGESFYKDMVPQIEELIRKSGVLEDSRGALGVDLGEELGFVRVFAEDGRSLYITRDIAAAIYRHEIYKPYKNLYVVAAQQSLHFKQLVGVFEKMNHPAAKEIVHIPFGFVPGMKTRGGGAISLTDFLNEAHDHALRAYREEVEKKPEGLNEEEVAESVAIGATYFYFLSHSNNKDFHFSWKEALSFQGDTGPYCQYALARLNSIMAKAKEAGLQPATSGIGEHATSDEAHELTTLIGRFDSVLESVTQSYEPNHLASYLLDIAKAFSKTYRGLRVIGEEKTVSEARLALFSATRNVLHTGLTLLGVPPVERM